MLLPPIVVQRIFVTSLFFATIALLVYLVGPHIRATLSRNAVVTAWLHVVTAPIDGTVAAAQLIPGTIAAADMPAVRIVNDRLYPGPVAEIARQISRLREEIAANEGIVAELERQVVKRRALAGAYVNTLYGDLEGWLRTEEANLAGTKAQIVDQRREVNRLNSLNLAGNAADAAKEHAQAQLENLAAFGRGTQEIIDRVRRRQGVVRDDVFLETSLADVPWGYKDAEALEIEILKYKAMIAESKASLQYLSGIATQVTLDLPAGMTLWDRLAATTSFVKVGDRVFSFIDCRLLLVDVVVTDGVMTLLSPGDPAIIHLVGWGGDLTGRIVLLRGSRAPLAEGHLAATIPDRVFREGQAIVEIDQAAVRKANFAACPVGLAAFVEFPSVGVVTEAIQRLRH
jgi:multidrug resistance efflux pump